MAFQYPGFQLNSFQITRRGDADAALPSLSAEGQGTVGIPAVVGHADISLPTLSVSASEQQKKGGGLARPSLPDEYYFRKPKPKQAAAPVIELEPQPEPVLAHSDEELTEILEILELLDLAA